MRGSCYKTVLIRLDFRGKRGLGYKTALMQRDCRGKKRLGHKMALVWHALREKCVGSVLCGRTTDVTAAMLSVPSLLCGCLQVWYDPL